MDTVLAELRSAVSPSSVRPDLEKCKSLLSKLKMYVVTLVPVGASPSLKASMSSSASNDKLVNSIKFVREALELGAITATFGADVPSFDYYFAQLKTYYVDYSSLLTPSEHQFLILGLNLLRLLADNRTADFHAELELIPFSELTNKYITYPLALEDTIMEGSYHKLWRSKDAVPNQLYLVFLEKLMVTMRTEICLCIQSSFVDLSEAECKQLLKTQSDAEFQAVKDKFGWKVNGGRVTFPPSQRSVDAGLPVTQRAPEVISRCMLYAKDIERIV